MVMLAIDHGIGRSGEGKGLDFALSSGLDEAIVQGLRGKPMETRGSWGQ